MAVWMPNSSVSTPLWSGRSQYNDFFACSVLPVSINQRGLSGTKNKQTEMKAGTI